jgi:hypothetical protein
MLRISDKAPPFKNGALQPPNDEFIHFTHHDSNEQYSQHSTNPIQMPYIQQLIVDQW